MVTRYYVQPPGRGRKPAISITSQGRIAFNATATRLFKEAKITECVVMFNREHWLFGPPTHEAREAGAHVFPIHYPAPSIHNVINWCGFTAKRFLEAQGYPLGRPTKKFAAEWDGKTRTLAVRIK